MQSCHAGLKNYCLLACATLRKLLLRVAARRKTMRCKRCPENKSCFNEVDVFKTVRVGLGGIQLTVTYLACRNRPDLSTGPQSSKAQPPTVSIILVKSLANLVCYSVIRRMGNKGVRLCDTGSRDAVGGPGSQQTCLYTLTPEAEARTDLRSVYPKASEKKYHPNMY